jgi:hypothetical protein
LGVDPEKTGRTPVEQIADRLTELGVAGATWAVCTWPASGFSPEQLAEAADEVRVRLADS